MKNFDLPLSFIWPGLALLLVHAISYPAIADESATASWTGSESYNYFCYQCHGYAGDARTLATTYLDPKPRNFSVASSELLTREIMIDAVTHGRSGSAMVSFTKVLTAEEIERVVDFVRKEFILSGPSGGRYHTEANGWPDHQRYSPAFPFATGEIPLDKPWEQLTTGQQGGKRLYLSSCISCHDRARTNEKEPVWDPMAVSYPRRHYSHQTTEFDALSGASTYAIHEESPELGELTESEARGRELYVSNCAFCHAPDGSGRNWIGSFLEPHPAQLTGSHVASISEAQLLNVIREGLPGTSMPSWKNVLSSNQTREIISYLIRELTAAG